jgi:tektin-3
MAFEQTEPMPLHGQSVTNYMVHPTSAEPVNFPNLIAGFEGNPHYAARAALYTRFTPMEWSNSNIGVYNQADTNRNFSERIRNDAVRAMRETDEKTSQGQRDAGRR